jgi:hypothetical protein
MPADPRQTARLRELHQDYVWRVNAAVAAGRDEVVDALCAEYAEEAVGVLTGSAPDSHPTPPPGPRRRWRSLLGPARRRSPHH